MYRAPSVFHICHWAVAVLTGVITTSTIAHASNGSVAAVPDATAAVLAPVGLAAIIVARRRHRDVPREHPAPSRYPAAKKIVDILFATILLIICSPILGMLALLVKLDSAGPVIYRRRVIGKNGRSFDMYKFRSMVADAEQILGSNDHLSRDYYLKCKLHNDPRVTRLGRLLRKTSLDELPQIINVMLGDMSFVGPRPIHAEETKIYGPDIEQFMTVTPGITGLWQIQGRSDLSYEARVALDMSYIRNRSALLDIFIILRTVLVVLQRRGAY